MKKIFYSVLVIVLQISTPTVAQQYIYFIDKYIDSTYGTIDTLSKIQRYNINSTNIEDFPPNQLRDSYVFFSIDPLQSFIDLGSVENSFTYNIVYNTLNPTDSFSLGNEDINEMLYSTDRNNLYIFSNEYRKIEVVSLSSKEITSILNLNNWVYNNPLLVPQRNSFFSLNGNNIYFFSKSYSSGPYQISTYSLNTNTVTQMRDIAELGYQNMDGYDITFGKKGRGVIRSYSNYNNPAKDFYFRIYDFDADSGSGFIYNDGRSDAIFNGNGEFLYILDVNNSTSKLFYEGIVKVFNVKSGQLLKSFSVPPGGTINFFDNYPNDIYYVLNLNDLDQQPIIYNLSQLKLHSISPALAIPYYARPIEPNILTITVTGEFFTDSTIAYYNGNPKTTTFVSDSVVTFNLNSTEFATAGDYSIWVSNYGSVSDTMYLSVVNDLPERLVLTFQCITYNPDNTLTAHFGYENLNEVAVGIVNYSDDNYFYPGDRYRGQPNVFLPGNHTNAFSVVFDGHNLTWHLLDGSLTVNKNSTPCH